MAEVMNEETFLSFVPSRIEGANEILRVAVFPDRLELVGNGRCDVIRFVNIARWPQPKILWRALFAIGIRPKWLPVADRDWFHLPAERFFRFYSTPPITIYMPVDEVRDYAGSHFFRIQQVLLVAGFHTFDLG